MMTGRLRIAIRWMLVGLPGKGSEYELLSDAHSGQNVLMMIVRTPFYAVRSSAGKRPKAACGRSCHNNGHFGLAAKCQKRYPCCASLVGLSCPLRSGSRSQNPGHSTTPSGMRLGLEHHDISFLVGRMGAIETLRKP
jgi:hypothetical protein